MKENIGEYRGKRKDNGEWVYGDYYREHRHTIKLHHIILEQHPMGDRHEVIPETVGQSTGKEAKNGEIFEGSNISFSTSVSQHYKGYVKWSNKGLCYLVHCYWEKQDEISHFCDGYEMNYKYENTCIKRLNSECFDIEIIHDKETSNQDTEG